MFADHGADDKTGHVRNPFESVLEEIELADLVGIDVFGVGEHHASEFLDSPPLVLLGAAAARTKRIRLLVALLVFHAGAALYHHFIRNDGLLRRMWYGG